MKLVLMSVLLLALGTGHAFAVDAASTCTVTRTKDVQPVLNSYCVACHQDASPAGGMSLQSKSMVANTVGVPSTESSTMPRITPGDADKSYLLHKLKGTQATAGGSGEKMPLGGQLPDEQIALIENWIVACMAAP